MSESLYEIPHGCICLGDGMNGMKCDAKTHARMKLPASLALGRTVRTVAEQLAIAALSGTPSGRGSGPRPTKRNVDRVERTLRRELNL